MGRYKVRIKKSALKELEAIASKKDRRRIVTRIEALAVDPRPPGAVKLSGFDRYRLQQGRLRILYMFRDRELIVYVVKIADRKGVYKR